MTSRLYNNESRYQLTFFVMIQDVQQFIVDGIQCGRNDTQVNHAALHLIYKEVSAEVAIPRHEDSTVTDRCLNQIKIDGLCESQFTGCHDVMVSLP